MPKNHLALFVGLADRLPREFDASMTAFRAEAETVRKRLAVARAATLVRTSWATTDDSRHYEPHWFFVKRYAVTRDENSAIAGIACYEKFWPTEIVSDRAAAERARPHQIGAFTDCALHDCAGCREPAPVIGRLVHDSDRANIDSWRIDLYALCSGCVRLTHIVEDFRTDPSR